ncbi:MAG: hypothetical protein ACOX3W_07845 [Christensenellaceae bacterium]
MEQKTVNKKVLKIPIILTAIYLALTIVIYILCPYDWPTKKPVLFYGLNFLYIAAIFGGYFIGIKLNWRLKRLNVTKFKEHHLVKILSVLAVVNFVMYLIYVFRSYGFNTFDFASLSKQMVDGLKNPGQGYLAHIKLIADLDGFDVIGGKIYTLISLMWGFLKDAVVVLCILYFKDLKIHGKVFTIAYMLLLVLFYISIGTNIRFFHIVLLLLLPVILKIFDLAYHKKLTFKKGTQLLSIILVGLLIFAVYFGWMMESRSKASGYEISDYTIGNVSPPKKPPKEPSEPTSQIGQKINNLWYSASSYLSQGYYGMSQALELKWVPMYGLGNSMFLVDTITKNFYDIDQFTYQVRLEPYGWDSDVRWHSMYTWVANDVSFYGVIVVMFALGIVFAMMFRDAIKEKDPFAQASIFFFIILIIFIPCNNQIAQSNETLCAFLTLIFLWFIGGRKSEKHSDVVIEQSEKGELTE